MLGFVGATGLEPATAWSQTRNATNCATPRLQNLFLVCLLMRTPQILQILAVRTGLEPVTPCVTGMYSNQLN